MPPQSGPLRPRPSGRATTAGVARSTACRRGPGHRVLRDSPSPRRFEAASSSGGANGADTPSHVRATAAPCLHRHRLRGDCRRRPRFHNAGNVRAQSRTADGARRLTSAPRPRRLRASGERPPPDRLGTHGDDPSGRPAADCVARIHFTRSGGRSSPVRWPRRQIPVPRRRPGHRRRRS